ncbi:hypothetical protein JHK87_001240 [Glycine soja]|nr:hypothetical protein JHK87_001240 [Glycine soja]
MGHVVWGFCAMPLVVVVSFSFLSQFGLALLFAVILQFFFVDNFVLQFSFAEFDREKLRVCDYKVMARVADKIKLIDGPRETLKLSVWITDLWFIGIPGKTEQAEMVVVDSDGDEIHVVCKQD